MAYNFEKLTAKQIKEYMDEYATVKQKKDFIEKAFVAQKEKVGRPIRDVDGNPIMFQVQDKEGNLKFDSEGKPIMRPKMEYVDKEGGKEKKVFSLLKAKWWFADTFPDAVDNVPKRKAKKEEASKLFADWFKELEGKS